MDSINQSFQYISLFLEINKKGTDYTVPQRKLSSWLNRFCKWSRTLPGNNSGPVSGYVELYTFQIFSVYEKARKLIASIRKNKLQVNIHIHLRDVVLKEKELQKILEDGPIDVLNVHVSEEDLPYAESFEKIVKKLCSIGSEIRYCGPVELLDRLNAYASETLNAKGMTFFPEQPSLRLSAAPKYPIKPCESRIQLHMGANGDIYPCQGLVEIEQFAIGNVEDKVFSHYLTYRCCGESLESLSMRGPKLSKNGKVADIGLPWICRRHLYEITKNA